MYAGHAPASGVLTRPFALLFTPFTPLPTRLFTPLFTAFLCIPLMTPFFTPNTYYGCCSNGRKAAKERSDSKIDHDLRFVLCKIFVCSFGDCARIRTNMGAKHLLDCALLECCNQYCAICGFPPTPCFAIQHAVLVFVVAISCEGQPPLSHPAALVFAPFSSFDLHPMYTHVVISTYTYGCCSNGRKAATERSDYFDHELR